LEKSLSVQEGQTFNNPDCTIDEKWTSPPSFYNEDTLLKSMETAGNKDYDPESDVEKKGLGTPATRAGTIEKLIKQGYIKRDGKNLTATDKGVNLIKIVPEELKSAILTVNWETDLQNIEKGKENPALFMRRIEEFVLQLIKHNSTALSEYADLFIPPAVEKAVYGKCPKCGGDVVNTPKAYSCDKGKDCGFVLWKEKSGRSITPKLAAQLLEKGKTEKVKGFKGKNGNFEAALILKADFTVGFEF
jgi:DNA topoisomerase-3